MTTRKKPQTSASTDPNINNTNRTFEVVYLHVLSEAVAETRLRIRVAKEGLEDNLFEVGDAQCYVGLISRPDAKAKSKWSGYSWGHLPMIPEGGGYAFEVFPDMEAPPKKEEPTP